MTSTTGTKKKCKISEGSEKDGHDSSLCETPKICCCKHIAPSDLQAEYFSLPHHLAHYMYYTPSDDTHRLCNIYPTGDCSSAGDGSQEDDLKFCTTDATKAKFKEQIPDNLAIKVRIFVVIHKKYEGTAQTSGYTLEGFWVSNTAPFNCVSSQITDLEVATSAKLHEFLLQNQATTHPYKILLVCNSDAEMQEALAQGTKASDFPTEVGGESGRWRVGRIEVRASKGSKKETRAVAENQNIEILKDGDLDKFENLMAKAHESIIEELRKGVLSLEDAYIDICMVWRQSFTEDGNWLIAGGVACENTPDDEYLPKWIEPS
eukprot:gnl/MRDRNA2_/MRDRNA2_220126_c0_seq1.p1 gnl/MRDRNA2_/MRDRNA2_220126_c0~~gnl/MRDRNA2_/MRDRNA2_220126_c0_seq1.p1  ORF type:complete len:327 (+),score=41.79 gnl/MRDRNA2_/MRDRNA2_220126_c0_seq1:25-981(+)